MKRGTSKDSEVKRRGIVLTPEDLAEIGRREDARFRAFCEAVGFGPPPDATGHEKALFWLGLSDEDHAQLWKAFPRILKLQRDFIDSLRRDGAPAIDRLLKENKETICVLAKKLTAQETALQRMKSRAGARASRLYNSLIGAYALTVEKVAKGICDSLTRRP